MGVTITKLYENSFRVSAGEKTNRQNGTLSHCDYEVEKKRVCGKICLSTRGFSRTSPLKINKFARRQVIYCHSVHYCHTFLLYTKNFCWHYTFLLVHHIIMLAENTIIIYCMRTPQLQSASENIHSTEWFFDVLRMFCKPLCSVFLSSQNAFGIH